MNNILNDPSDLLPGYVIGNPNYDGNPVVVEGTMRSRLVGRGFGFWRWYYDIPDQEENFLGNTWVDFKCTRCGQ
jgi:hypothetical protein